jgi:beta-mannosidase
LHRTALSLCNGWYIKEYDATNTALSLDASFRQSEGWLPATVPGTVHQDLLAAGRIPDPYFGTNELVVQWVGERDWLYRCTFDLPYELYEMPQIDLCFDGLDTFATIWLNGTQILVNENMFVPQRVAVKALLRPQQNELRIHFASALQRGKALEARYGKRAVWNGDASRVYVRKAQYHYGWDWGPCLLTVGPWQPVRLEAYATRILDLHCPATVAADLASATLPVSITLNNSASTLLPLHVELTLFDAKDKIVASVTLPVTATTLTHTFTIEQPQLWWPNGYGAQARYRLRAVLRNDQTEFDTLEIRLGLHRLRLIQQPIEGEAGTTFFFEVNNTPVFCGGANWIPADMLVPRVTAERYRTYLTYAAAAHMTMIRVWGGGIYEQDVFYDLCDELGLLVWQDFMFACGIYPAHEEFRANVRQEAEAALRRLRHHPCLALWCGNNEDYSIAESTGQVNDDFPARTIYEQLLPVLCAELDPTRPYWPGSPYGGSFSGDPTVGDRHTWEIWHGPVAPYQDYDRFRGRFVSEFGLEAAPALSTVYTFTTPQERYAQSRTFEHHNKATDGTRRLAMYLSDNVSFPSTLEDYIYRTQFLQAEAMAYAIRAWRRRWGKVKQYEVAGALVWQLNDCWPATSWAIIDSMLHTKPAYYTIKRELAPFTVGLKRDGERCQIWATNGTLQECEVTLHLCNWTLDGQLIEESQQQVTLTANSATELGSCPFLLAMNHVLSARLIHNGQVIARTSAWPEPFKYLALPQPGLKIVSCGKDSVTVSVERPAKGVLLSTDTPLLWSDNMLDVFPDDPQTLSAPGLGVTPIRIDWLR